MMIESFIILNIFKSKIYASGNISARGISGSNRKKNAHEEFCAAKISIFNVISANIHDFLAKFVGLLLIHKTVYAHERKGAYGGRLFCRNLPRMAIMAIETE